MKAVCRSGSHFEIIIQFVIDSLSLFESMRIICELVFPFVKHFWFEQCLFLKEIGFFICIMTVLGVFNFP